MFFQFFCGHVTRAVCAIQTTLPTATAKEKYDRQCYKCLILLILKESTFSKLLLIQNDTCMLL